MLLDFMPRLRMFADRTVRAKAPSNLIRTELLGVYVKPDEIEAFIKRNDYLDFGEFEIQTKRTEVLEFFRNSTRWKKPNFGRS